MRKNIIEEYLRNKVKAMGKRCRNMEGIIKEVSTFCQAGYKYEIEKALGMVN